MLSFDTTPRYDGVMSVENEKENGSGIRVISRAAAILNVLKTEQRGMSLGEIAKAVSLPRATVQRIVAALEMERFVLSGPSPGSIRIGPAFLGITATLLSDMQAQLRPYLQALSDEIEETVDLSVLVGTDIVFIDQIRSPHRRLQAVSAVGAEFPAYACAPGKCLLAELDPTVVVKIFPPDLPAMTPGTISDTEGLMGELTEIRRAGIAFDREEHTSGICAVSTAVTMEPNRVVAVSIPVPAHRFYDGETKYADALADFRHLVAKIFAG